MKRLLSLFSFVFLLSIILTNCSDADSTTVKKNGQNDTSGLFELKSVAESGIDFTNTITEDETYNHILIDVIVNGGGVAVVDINNDDLLDIFFAGNMVSDKLYLNKGDLKFEDITKSAGVEDDSWSTAVAVADVNNDGFQDIYVGKFAIQEPGKLKNELYINNGDLTFTESAEAYGLNHDGHCTAANFFDYDLDGDLDLYLGIEPFVLRHLKYDENYKYNPTDFTDRLYRNNGDGSFTDVTKAAGMENFNFTLAATVSDVNHDGYPDMYVASDYEEPDYYYINNGDGTFTNQIHTAMRHISNFSMGVDIADINNDGWPDIVVADMAPEDNYRSKANMSGMNPEKFWGLARGGYHYQYMFNTLQLNNGNGTYSEIGHMANIAQTDWSWATLLADYDLDGDKDLYITNGQLRDIRNKDYVKKINHAIDSLSRLNGGGPASVNALPLVNYAPQEKLANYMFVNNNDLGFENETEKWGLPEKTFSQGAAYADLDNDGDLDLLVNNMNDRAFLYENHATEKLNHHYLSFKFKGESIGNPLAYGTKVWIFTSNGLQLQEVAPVRGYMSSSDPVITFGLGQSDKVDRVVIQWPGGKVTELKDVAADQRLTLSQADGEMKPANIYHIDAPMFKDITASSKLPYAHRENRYDDYKDEVLIPHRMSHLGPAAAKADVNGDGLEDMYLGGAAGSAGTLFLQNADNTLQPAPSQPWQQDKASEDVHAHFFDADGDGDADLYVTSGGNEFKPGDAALADRLYVNQGNGQFAKSNNLPTVKTSGGVAVSGDIDNDGDLDLFVGGRQIPGKYGYPAESYLLRNDNGKFVDATQEIFPENSELGMVSDAVWLDVDQDQDLDLVVVGEWMPITIFKNDNGKLTDEATASLADTRGWWNRLAIVDLDGDGDQDLVAGNVGRNIKFKASKEQPFKAYINDFDNNGTNDVYLAYYDRNGNELPVRGRQCSSEQMDFVLEEFPTYHDFAQASVEDVLAGRMEGAVELEAYEFSSVILRNDGQGNFAIEKLPAIAQSFPIYGIVARDWNADGIMDLVLVGNYHEREVETTRSDAGIGTVLLGQNDGSFKPLPAYETGIYAYFDARNLLSLENSGKPLLVVVNNNEGAQVYQ
jgi:hypothetical protein